MNYSIEFNVGQPVLPTVELEHKSQVVIVHPEAQGVACGVVSLEQAPATAVESSLFQVSEI